MGKIDLSVKLPIESYFEALVLAVNFAKAIPGWSAMGFDPDEIDAAISRNGFEVDLLPVLDGNDEDSQVYRVNIEDFCIDVYRYTGECYEIAVG